MLILDSFILELLILLGTLFAGYYIYWMKVKSKFWLARNVPHLEPKFLGNALTCGTTVSMRDFFTDLYNKHKEKGILGFWSLNIPVIAVFDRELFKTILVRDFSYFHDRLNLKVGDHDPLVGGNLFNLSGHAWRNMRVKLTPTFSSGKMKMMFPTMVQCGDELRSFLKESANAGEAVDCKDVSARFTTNIIASCAFGIETNSLKNPDNEFRHYGKQIFSPSFVQIMKNLLAVIFPLFGNLFKISQLPDGTTEFFVNTVKETMDYRKENNVRRNDFMQLLIELKEKGKIEDVDKDDKDEDIAQTGDTKFSLNEAAAQAFVFFAAGFETASTTMSLALFELAKNQEVQKTLRSEITEAVKNDNGEIVYETICKLDYLECVIQETLRKYPVVPVLMREAARDYYLAEMGVTIPKGTIIFLPSCGFTSDTQFFSEPKKFDPTRFLAERKNEIPEFCHIPFGEGPRNCIGSRFGMLQTKVGLVSFLVDNTVKPSEKTPEELKFDPKGLTLTFTEGLYLNLIPDRL